VLLSEHFVEAPRPHPHGEGLVGLTEFLGGFIEQTVHALTLSGAASLQTGADRDSVQSRTGVGVDSGPERGVTYPP
jgi:hypothetical protein